MEQQDVTDVHWAKSKELRLVTDALPVLISYIDKNLIYRFNNAYYETWFGRPMDEILGRHVMDVVGETTFRQRLPYLERALQGERLDFDADMPMTGEARAAHIQYVPHRADDGQVAGLFVLVSDIEERKLGEEALLASNQRLTILAEAVERASGAVSLDELAQIVGKAARQLCGATGAVVALRQGDRGIYAAEDSEEQRYKGRSFALTESASGWAILNGEIAVVPDISKDMRVLEAARNSPMKSGMAVPIGKTPIRASMAIYWYEPHDPSADEISVIKALGRAAGAVLTRIEAEEALRNLAANLEAEVAARTADRDRMWRLSTDVMLVARFDATITAVNPAWERILGWKQEDLVGSQFMDLVHPEDVASTLNEVRRLSDGRTTERFENRYQAKDGSYRWLSWIAVPDTGLIHAVGRDVTAEKEAAEALARAEEHLRHSQKMEAIGQLTGGIAHDFNNMLTGVIGSLDMIQRTLGSPRTDKLERYARVAMMSAQRAAALTQRLLAFGRRQSLDLKPIGLNQLVTGMEELLLRTLGENIRLRIELDPDLWLARTDMNQAESALLNLCINARDAMPDGGTLVIKTQNETIRQPELRKGQSIAPGEYVVLSISDTGTGMSEETLSKVFEPFFTTKPIGEGTGLGLSMIYGFVNQSGGHIRLSSALGQGTTARLFFPRSSGILADDRPEPALPSPQGKGETVLVVEDDASVRTIVIELLGELGYQAIETIDAKTALPVLNSDRPIDLLISDVGLPGLNGRELAELARKARPELKILFITGYAANAANRSDFLGPGMDMLAKPFPIEVLATRIKEMLG